jgi:hypothetical protein
VHGENLSKASGHKNLEHKKQLSWWIMVINNIQLVLALNYVEHKIDPGRKFNLKSFFQ